MRRCGVEGKVRLFLFGYSPPPFPIPVPPPLWGPRTYRIAHALRHRTGGRLQATQGERLGGRGAGGEDGHAHEGQCRLVAEHA